MASDIKYRFQWFERCVMCDDPVESHKVMGVRLNRSQGFRPKQKKGISVTVCKCGNCGLIYSNPMPVPENINDHYGIDPDKYWSTEYFQVANEFLERELSSLEKLMPIRSGMKALDIGAGIGKGLVALQRRGFDAYGLEPSKTFYQYAVSKMGISEDRMICSTLHEADFQTGYFDFISLYNVVEHVYDPFETTLKAVQWLKPGGIIHIEVPSSRYLISKIINTYYRMIGTNYVTNISPMHVPFHLFEFSHRSFRLAVKRMNAAIVKIENFTGGIVGVPFSNFHLLKRIMKATGTGVDIVVWITKHKQ